MSKDLIEQSQFPAPPAWDQDRTDGAAALKLSFRAFELVLDGVYSGNLDEAQDVKRRLDEIVPRAESLRASLEYQRQRATNQEMIDCLAVLVKSFPERQGEDASVFGRALAEEVGRMRPSIGALYAACGHLRRTLTRQVYIADVVQTIEAGEGNVARWCEALMRLEAQRDALAKKISEAEKQLRIKQAHPSR